MKSLINSEIFRSRPLPITTPSSFLYPTLNYVQKWSIVHLYPADLTFAYRTKLGGSTNECAEFKRRGEVYWLSTRTALHIRHYPRRRDHGSKTHDIGSHRSVREPKCKSLTAQYVALHPNEFGPSKWAPSASTLAPSLGMLGK